MASIDYHYLAEIVSRAQRGDSNAFAELYASTYNKQYRFACSYLHDQDLAQDAVQEIYLLVFKNIQKLHEPSLLIAWINQIAFRVCYDLQKKQKLYNQELADYQAENVEGTVSIPSPESEIVEIDTRQYLIDQIAKLPFSESQAITLKYYKNMSLDEIADFMEISRSTVKRYLRSGKERLAQILKE